MLKEFTAENLQRLKDLYVDLSFRGEQLDGKFGANVLNPFELLTQTTIATLRSLLKQVRGSAKELQDLDEWSLSTHQQAKQKRFESWAEFVNLLIGYRLDQDEKAASKAEKAKKMAALKARIETESDKGKTLEDLKKELAELQGQV